MNERKTLQCTRGELFEPMPGLFLPSCIFQPSKSSRRRVIYLAQHYESSRTFYDKYRVYFVINCRIISYLKSDYFIIFLFSLRLSCCSKFLPVRRTLKCNSIRRQNAPLPLAMLPSYFIFTKLCISQMLQFVIVVVLRLSHLKEI